MSEGPQEFDYRAAYIAEQGTRQYAERELQEARQEVERLRALLAGLVKGHPPRDYVSLSGGHEMTICDYCGHSNFRDRFQHLPGCRWLQAKQALTDAPQQGGPKENSNG